MTQVTQQAFGLLLPTNSGFKIPMGGPYNAISNSQSSAKGQPTRTAELDGTWAAAGDSNSHETPARACRLKFEASYSNIRDCCPKSIKT